MDGVRAQYEAYPYPERDPAHEATRPLIVGSPSHPLEIDHFLFAGHRDWSRPFRALVAGGGTGDGLVMLAQLLKDAGVEADVTYLDISAASRAIAEARMAARGLAARFVNGPLEEAGALGPFDYVDCCGVLHHLADPDAGLAALKGALAEGGGMGLMVYAPYGRAGVYEMQDALKALTAGEPPEARVGLAKRLLGALPPTNGLRRNPFVGDHLQGGDAGLYDLLLHERDRAYDVPALHAYLGRSGMRLAGFATPGRYDPAILIADPELRQRAAALPPGERQALAERLAGNIRTHVLYAVPEAREETVALPAPDAVPCLLGVEGAALATSLRREGAVQLGMDGLTIRRPLPPEAADLLDGIDGRRTIAQIGAALGWEEARTMQAFATLWRPLDNFNLLRFSRLHRRGEGP